MPILEPARLMLGIPPLGGLELKALRGFKEERVGQEARRSLNLCPPCSRQYVPLP